MAKILLVTPHTTLRQAIRLFLFPDHVVTALPRLGGADPALLQKQDAWILDGSAPAAQEHGNSELTRWLKEERGRLLWLEEEGSPCPIENGKIFRLPLPLRRESLGGALEQLLKGTATGNDEAPVPQSRVSPGDTPADRKSKRKSADRKMDEGNPIDLVEVVQEVNPADKEGKESQ